MAADPNHPDAPSHDGRMVQLLLRAGLAGASVLMAAGLVVQLATGNRASHAVRMFEVGRVGLGLGERLMALGILVLAFTPVFRVLMLIGLWIRERDWRFVGVAVTVTVALSVAIALGGG